MSRDYCALISVQWLYKLASNVMIMSPIKKEYRYHNLMWTPCQGH